MWIRPNWGSNEIFENKVFWVLPGDTGKGNMAVLGFYMYRERQYLYFANISDFDDIHSQANGYNMIHTRITWAADQWHHILVCWDKERHYRALYVDDKFKDATRYAHNMPGNPTAFYLGYMPGNVQNIADGYQADVAIDDFKLYKTVKGKDFYHYAHDPVGNADVYQNTVDRLKENYSLEKVAKEHLEVQWDDLTGLLTPMTLRVPVHARYHPDSIFVHPDLSLSLGYRTNSYTFGFALGDNAEFPDMYKVEPVRDFYFSFQSAGGWSMGGSIWLGCR